MTEYEQLLTQFEQLSDLLEDMSEIVAVLAQENVGLKLENEFLNRLINEGVKPHSSLPKGWTLVKGQRKP